MSLPAYEKLGLFYLGRTVAPSVPDPGGELLLYDARDLTTHAVCVGMTGSGKTGLGIALLEEAALDAIPALVIDPKGDLANLTLTFPTLDAAAFLPWVAAEEAGRRGITVEALAAEQAAAWARGLADSGQDGERIERLRAAAEFTVYTPGSQAGVPVSVLQSFAAPAPALRSDVDALRERIGATTHSLLGLLGYDADPLQSREHILVANILEHCWSRGTDIDLAALVHLVQEPPVTRLGVLELESFFPSKERQALAMRLNNLLASPGFQAWLEGAPLDVQRFLYTSTGKPRVAIFSIAHLPDAERMFFVSLLLGQVLGWMRTQPGTSSLRALLYMDEIFGYLPPTANPPSKLPLLTLLKQARAFGLGVVVATQNPVDLDYKALANAGTWFIGRLQTERDKLRLLDGLESARGTGALDRQTTDRLLSGLEKRMFLLHDVHRDAPSLFRTRWTLSYLRGPMTREEIKRLRRPDVAPVPPELDVESGRAAPLGGTVPARAVVSEPAAAPAPGVEAAPGNERPALPAAIPQAYLPAAPGAGSAAIVYAPMLFAVAQVGYVQARPPLDHTEELQLLVPFADKSGVVDWSAALTHASPAALGAEAPATMAQFAALPGAAAVPKSYGSWQRALADWLFRNRTLTVFRSDALSVDSRPGEAEGEFKARLRDLLRSERDRRLDALRTKHATRLARLQEKVRRAEAAVGRENEQLQQARSQTAISIGATVLGALFGGGRRAGTLGRATTTARGMQRAELQEHDVAQARASLEAARRELAAFEAEVDQAVAAAVAALALEDPACTGVALRPKKARVHVARCGLAWVPGTRNPDGTWTMVAAIAVAPITSAAR